MANATDQIEAARAKHLPRATREALSADALAAHADALARPEVAAALDAHLAHYAATGECPGCGGTLWTWGLVHGCGSCCRCGWPVRAYHFVEGLPRLVGALYAHPEDVETR